MTAETEFMVTLKKMIKSVKNNIDFYEVVSYTYTENPASVILQVKKVIEKTSQLYVITSGIGLGNDKGIVCGYEVGDTLLCTNINGQLIILTSIYNQFYSQKDTVIAPKEKEIIIKSSNGAKIKLDNDGGFKIYNKNNYGITVNKDGNITIHGATVNFTQSPGEF